MPVVVASLEVDVVVVTVVVVVLVLVDVVLVWSLHSVTSGVPPEFEFCKFAQVSQSNALPGPTLAQPEQSQPEALSHELS